MSQDIFQMRMDDIVAQCPGELAIRDNVFIYGKDDRDHDVNIINLFNVAQKEGLIFNSTKCSIKQDSVTFFGGVFSANGYSPDPEKIQGITEMTAPQTKQGLQSFLGAANYLQTFVPHLSHHTEPLPALLKKENSFTWDENSNTSFQKIKSISESIAETPKVLWQKQTSHPPTMWCFTQGTWSLHHTEQTSHSFCEQVFHQYRDIICKHQEGTPSHCVWLWKVPHLPVW